MRSLTGTRLGHIPRTARRRPGMGGQARRAGNDPDAGGVAARVLADPVAGGWAGWPDGQVPLARTMTELAVYAGVVLALALVLVRRFARWDRA